MKVYLITYSLLLSGFLSTPLYAQFERGGEKISPGLAWGQWDGLAIAQTKQFRDDRKYTADSHRFVQGSPYFDREFKKSEIDYYGEKVTKPVYLRYNANTDELEMSTYAHTGETEQMLMQDENVSATFNNETYYYRSYYKKESEVTKGYFIALSLGTNYELYKKIEKVFQEAKVAKTSLEKSFPARFVDKTSFYYRDTKSKILQEIKPSKKTYKSMLSKADYSKFSKSSKELDTKEQELISLFSLLNIPN